MPVVRGVSAMRGRVVVLRAGEGAADRVVTAPLVAGRAAQVVRAYGLTSVRVSDLIPSRLVPEVVVHALSRHERLCTAEACLAGRRWLGRARPTTDRAPLTAVS